MSTSLTLAPSPEPQRLRCRYHGTFSRECICRRCRSAVDVLLRPAIAKGEPNPMFFWGRKAKAHQRMTSIHVLSLVTSHDNTTVTFSPFLCRCPVIIIQLPLPLLRVLAMVVSLQCSLCTSRDTLDLTLLVLTPKSIIPYGTLNPRACHQMFQPRHKDLQPEAPNARQMPFQRLSSVQNESLTGQVERVSEDGYERSKPSQEPPGDRRRISNEIACQHENCLGKIRSLSRVIVERALSGWLVWRTTFKYRIGVTGIGAV
ncbi:uncharacterized protein BJX67DRAFT_133806 [Aspergillus lucknowensis]|uniref:Uncharacterized protein n=1 Tax=Aspergillus lucknowensis TaxID=176173 RepID=A0ABR4LPZ0_9EURO